MLQFPFALINNAVCGYYSLPFCAVYYLDVFCAAAWIGIKKEIGVALPATLYKGMVVQSIVSV